MKARILYALDEPLILLPLDKTGTGSDTSCVVLRASRLFYVLKRASTALQLHHYRLPPVACVGVLRNFGGLYSAYRALALYSCDRHLAFRTLRQQRLCFMSGAALDALKLGGMPRWWAAPFYHLDACVAPRGGVLVRVGVGRGNAYAVDASPYYAIELLAKRSYQVSEGAR